MANKGGSRHMKVSQIPASWPRGGKSVRFLAKPRPGPHSREYSVPLVKLVRDVFGLAGSAREARVAIQAGKVKINGRVRKDEKFPVGAFDLISVEDHGDFCLLPKKGVGLFPIPYQGPRFLRVEGKKLYSGKYQFSFHDGSTFLMAKEDPLASARVGSSMVFELKGEKWVPTVEVPVKEGAQVVIVGGKNEGVLGVISSMAEDLVNVNTPDGRAFQTSKDHVYAIDDRIFSALSGAPSVSASTDKGTTGGESA